MLLWLNGAGAFAQIAQVNARTFRTTFGCKRTRISGSRIAPRIPTLFRKILDWELAMGGYGSGRTGGRPTTDNGLTLDLSKLRRDGLFRPGSAGGSYGGTREPASKSARSATKPISMKTRAGSDCATQQPDGMAEA